MKQLQPTYTAQELNIGPIKDEDKDKQDVQLGSGPQNYEWYQTIKKSKINPPQWVFPIVWTILYIMIGISFFFYLMVTQFKFTIGLLMFCIQMFLNIIWTPLFFWKKMITIALVDIVLMWIFILLTIIFCHQYYPISAYLLIPYLCWVTLATYLNAYIVKYNEDPYFAKKGNKV